MHWPFFPGGSLQILVSIPVQSLAPVILMAETSSPIDLFSCWPFSFLLVIIIVLPCLQLHLTSCFYGLFLSHPVMKWGLPQYSSFSGEVGLWETHVHYFALCQIGHGWDWWGHHMLDMDDGRMIQWPPGISSSFVAFWVGQCRARVHSHGEVMCIK